MQSDRMRLHLKVAVAFLIAAAAGALLIVLDDHNHVLQGQKAAVDVASNHGHLLQERIDRSLSATYALAAVLRQGHGQIDHFDQLAGEMLRLYGGIGALGLAPGAVVRKMLPLAGNEAAIGHDLLKDPKRSQEVRAAIETRKLTLAGPFKLVQGGIAVVGRLPVFLPNAAGAETFWGLTVALIHIDALLEASRLNAIADAGYEFELSRIHPDSGRRDVFAGSAAAPLADAVSFRIAVPNGQWTLAIAPAAGWHLSRATLAAEAALALLASLMVAGLSFHVLKQPQVLRREVELRTRDLNETNRWLQAEIVEREHAEGALRDAQQVLQAARDDLELRVVARTRELSEANAALQDEKQHQQALIKKLEDAHGQLLQSEKMASIGQLAAGIAHEINNPIGFVNSNLGTLRLYAEQLLALSARYEGVEPLLTAFPEVLAELAAAKEQADLAYLREDLPSLLKDTQDGVVRVRKIVQDLKEFSHVDETEWQLADLHQGLESTLNVVWNEIKYKATVVREYGELPLVECIASQVNQVFMNLLVNAAQAIAGQGTITIRSRRQGEFAWIEIADTGTGIPPEQVGRIFEPFFTTKPVGKGTGLGLSLSYGIIQKHGGRIEVRSALGQGSAFGIWLPVARRSPAAEAESAVP